MRLARHPAEFDDDLRALAKALGRLVPEQGRQARLNARYEVRRALARLRERVDQTAPVIARAPAGSAGQKGAKKALSLGQRVDRFHKKMTKRGWKVSPSKELIATLATAGVRPRRSPNGIDYFVPEWAVLAATQDMKRGYNLNKVEECRKSVTARKALLAAARLTGYGSTSHGQL